MSRRKVKAPGEPRIGNWLAGGPAQPSRPTTPSKRANDATPLKPPKRPKIDDEGRHDVVSVASSSELPRPPVSAAGFCKKGPQDSQSLQSSGDGAVNGRAIGEYRKMTQMAGFGKKRPRHKAPGVRMQNRAGDHDVGVAPAPAFNKPRRLISQHPEIPGDHIQDEDEVTFISEESRPRKTNGQIHSNHYTSSTFEVPGSDGESEDEISAQPLTVKKHESTVQKPSGHARGNAPNGRKRQNEVGSDEDELQVATNAKRRPMSSSRADIRKTTFRPVPMAVTLGGHIDFRIHKAVCDPSYVYPAEGKMYKEAPGASNAPCRLVRSEDGDVGLAGFKAVDDEGSVLPELEWMTPKVAKIQQIATHPGSPIVQIMKSLDHTTDLRAGKSLFVEFRNPKDAQRYVSRCREVNRSIELKRLAIEDLVNLMGSKLSEIQASNMKKPAPSLHELSHDPPSDVKLIARRDAVRNHINSRTPIRSVQPGAQQSGHSIQTKRLRIHMKADDEPEDQSIRSEVHAPEETLMTPAQEKHMRSIVEDDDLGGNEFQDDGVRKRMWQAPSHVKSHESDSQPKRSLRSSKPMARISSALSEKWTKKNPTWADNWKVPLVYERTTVNKDDIERLDEGELLNDEIISFYVKYLHKQLEDKDEQLANKVYVFNSFFWETLKTKGYDGVKKWTAKIDLLSFDYVIVPINQSAHWYLAIVCNAKGLLPREDRGPDTEQPADDETRDQAEVHPEDAADKVAIVTSDISHISIDDQPNDSASNNPVGGQEMTATRKSKVSKKGAAARKYDPKSPRVIVLDSLGESHSHVASGLKKYLQAEIKHKKDIDIDVPTSFGMTAKDIPCQPNFTDCGVYLLGYVREFMRDPDKFTRKILQQEERDWDVDAPSLRNEIRELILQLHHDCQNQEMRRKREMRLLAQAKKRESTLESPVPPASEPTHRVASEQRAQQPSASSSPAKSSQKMLARSKSNPIGGDEEPRTSVQRQGIRSSPLPASDQCQEASSNRSQSSGPETPNNNNASMIVNVDDSANVGDDANLDDNLKIVEQLGSAGPKIKPRLMKSIENDEQGQRKSPIPIKSPVVRQTPPGSDAKFAAPFDETKLLKVIPSSSRAHSRSASEESNKLMETSKTKTPAGQNTDEKSGTTRSPYFMSSSLKPSSVVKFGTSKNRPASYVRVIPSSDEESCDRKTKGKQSNTIDLTSDE